MHTFTQVIMTVDRLTEVDRQRDRQWDRGRSTGGQIDRWTDRQEDR